MDYKEWHEGFVTQFHKSGKHLVEFRMVNEKRWLQMKKIAFYIVERTHIGHNDDGEFKDDVEDEDGLAPLEVMIGRIFIFEATKSLLDRIIGFTLKKLRWSMHLHNLFCSRFAGTASKKQAI